jgi:hypothetical protein
MRQLAERPAMIQQLAANIEPVRTLVEHVDDLEAIYDEIGHADRAVASHGAQQAHASNSLLP